MIPSSLLISEHCGPAAPATGYHATCVAAQQALQFSFSSCRDSSTQQDRVPFSLRSQLRAAHARLVTTTTQKQL
jgi:hypothetical protein